MVPEMEKPGVTEIRVRMDCNGCVQKIKKALHGITGISDLYIDIPQQKVTIMGSVDPAKIVKAIKKTRKSVVVCIHTEQSNEAAQSEAEPESKDGVQMEGAPPSPPAQQPQVEVLPPAEGQTEEAPPNSSPKSANETSQSTHHSKPRNLEEIHVVHHRPPDYRPQYAYGQYPQQDTGRQWSAYSNGPQIRGEPLQPPQPIHVTHSYNTYKASPYVTEYAFPSRPPPADSRYGIPEHYTREVYYSGNNASGYSGGPQIREELSQPPQPIHRYSIHNSAGSQWDANLRGEPSQPPPPPIHHFSVHNSNGRQWNANLRGEPSQPPPPPIHHCSGSNSRGQWNTHLGGPQIRGEEPQSPHAIHYYSGNSSSNGRYWNAPSSGPEMRGEPCQPTHSYNTYKPSPYATEYAYPQSPQGYSHYNTPDHYNQVYYCGNNGNGNVSGNITSLFSEEDPNSCSIV